MGKTAGKRIKAEQTKKAKKQVNFFNAFPTQQEEARNKYKKWNVSYTSSSAAAW